MFSDKLKELRKARGLSQEELSEVLDVSRQSISKYENGTAEPDIDKLAIMVKFFDVSFDYLLGEDEKELTSEKIVIKEGDQRISIISNIDGRMSSYYKFKISQVIGKQDYHPAAQLLGIDSHSFLGDHHDSLGWYATIEDAQKEIECIYSAIAQGKSNYKLSYDVPVKKRGILDFEIDYSKLN